jgi:SAM-dependent methyltransferase
MTQMSPDHSQVYIHGSSSTERQRLALMNELINARCLQALQLRQEQRVLDVGAGTGQFTRLMSQHLPLTSRIVAVERNPEQRNAALELAATQSDSAATGCSIDFRLGDAFDLPLSPDEWGRFDLAHTRFLLEHVADPLGVVQQMVKAVRPGGRIVLLDDDHDLLRFWPEPPGLADAWQAYFESYRAIGNDPLIGRKLPQLLHQAGAVPSRIDYVLYGACSGEAAFAGIVGNLVGVLQGARATVLATSKVLAEEYDQAVLALQRFATVPGATIWYVINFAEGIKPAESP